MNPDQRLAAVLFTLAVMVGCQRPPDWALLLDEQAISADAMTSVVRNAVEQREEVKSVEVVEELVLNVELRNQEGVRECSFHSLIASLSDQASERLQQVMEVVDVCVSDSALVSHVDPRDVRPLLRPAAYLDHMIEQRPEDPPVFERIDGLDTLAVGYVIDRPGSITFLVQSDIDDAAIEQAALKRIAMQNLRAVADRLLMRECRPPLCRLTLDGWYEESLILLPGLWNDEQSGVAGDPIVAVPARGVLIYTGTREEDGLTRLRAAVAEYTADEATVLSPNLLCRREGRWIELHEKGVPQLTGSANPGC